MNIVDYSSSDEGTIHIIYYCILHLITSILFIFSENNTSTTFSNETISRIESYIQLRENKGFDLTTNIRSKKDFGNPQILQKVIDHFNIDQVFLQIHK
jgi:hypothetical protein